MQYFLVIVCTVISCYLFEITTFNKQVNSLLSSYILTFYLLKRKVATELIIAVSARQLKLIFLLFLKLIRILLPFLVLGIYLYIKQGHSLRMFAGYQVNIVIIFTAAIYFLIKRYAFK